MNLCAMTVWYNPQKNESQNGERTPVQNVLSYFSHFSKVYIVDNSDIDNSDLAKEIPNAVYIANFKNTGIAAALNTGCRKAKDDGFEWILTMDQDSYWEDDELVKFIEAAKRKIMEDSSIKSLAAWHYQAPNHSFLGIIARKLHVYKTSAIELPNKYADRCITSGNIIELETWEKIGGFNEKLFIDEVDHEFCFRLRDAGYKIFLLYKEAKFNHALGIKGKHLLPRSQFHNPFRVYYMARNMTYVSKKFPVYAKEFNYKGSLRNRLVHNVLLTPPYRCMGILKRIYVA